MTCLKFAHSFFDPYDANVIGNFQFANIFMTTGKIPGNTFNKGEVLKVASEIGISLPRFVEDRDNREMQVWFDCDEDLFAFKLVWEGDEK